MARRHYDPPPMDLSIIMPAFNEKATILDAMDQVLREPMPVAERELIVVDDGSTDGTAEALTSREWPEEVQVVVLPINVARERRSGRGSSARAGRCRSFDADIEYDPADIAKMVPLLEDDHIDAVFGTRMWQAHSAYGYWYVVGNRVINTTANVLFNAWLSDCCAGVKVFPTDLLRSLGIQEDGFAVEAEMTGRLLRRGARIYEVPITYRARAREEGKKIHARDGVRIMTTLFRCRLGRP